MSSNWIHALADVADLPHAGGKARNLARLIAAGLPVPPGFVIDDHAFTAAVANAGITRHNARAIVASIVGESNGRGEAGHTFVNAADTISANPLPGDLSSFVHARAAALGGSLAVRSSATIEDGTAGSAAGLFSSETAVPLASVDDAIKSVWVSALAPVISSYAGHYDGTAAPAVTIAVIVQRFVPGERVIVYTRRPGMPDGPDALVQRGGTLAQLRRDDGDPVVTLALRAEAAIGADKGADVELVVGDEIVVVQARPIVHPLPARTTLLPSALTAALVADGRRWTWDVAHNPDPLSTAQTELVDLVEREKVGTYALRVCGGYLYATPIAMPVPPPLEHLADIEQRMDEALGPDEELALDDALARYVTFYSLWANELSPLVYAERVKVRRFTSRPSSVEESLIAAATGQRTEADVIAHLGMLAPAWDVAASTFQERPGVVRDAIARARTVYPLGSETLFDTPDPDGIGADLGERDDRWFARAQWMVRRALLAQGETMGIGDDVFWIPFADLHAGIDADAARRKAAGARAAAARATQWEPPLEVYGAEPVRDERRVLRGIGTGGRAVGRVVRLASLASVISVGPGDVVVTRAFTPALAVVVIGCAALISESGELLDHASSMARELGIPAVVGCRDAWRLLDDGMIVEIDAYTGEVRPCT